MKMVNVSGEVALRALQLILVDKIKKGRVTLEEVTACLKKKAPGGGHHQGQKRKPGTDDPTIAHFIGRIKQKMEAS